MQLYGSVTSPYVRKVRATADVLGIADTLEMVAVNTMAPTPEFQKLNPVSKIPVLGLPDGSILYDSPVICEYLNDAFGGGRLLPSDPVDRARRRTLLALADGILDAGIAVRMETLRPDSEQSPGWIEKQVGNMARGFDRLEETANTLGDDPDLATIAVGCAVAWCMFRHGQHGWLSSRPKLAAWYERFSALPCMASTAPPAS